MAVQLLITLNLNSFSLRLTHWIIELTIPGGAISKYPEESLLEILKLQAPKNQNISNYIFSL